MNEASHNGSPNQESEKEGGDSTFFAHIVPQFHYDAEYVLTLGEYLEISFNNLIEAHRILSKHDNYTYLVEQVFLLEQFFIEHPLLGEDFAKWANEGRLEVASGMYAMACVNMPSGESLVRQLVYGKKWCSDNLGGYEPKCFNNGDCPGGHRQMPQIAKICGYDYFIFERGVDSHERESEFIWRGIEGTELKTSWLPLGYGGWRPSHGSGDDVASISKAIETLKKHATGKQLLLATGGDFRYPDESGIAAVEKFNCENDGIFAAYSTYAKGQEQIDWNAASVCENEFNPDRQGYFSGRPRLKQLNRVLERMLFTTEALSVTSRNISEIPYDAERIDRAWKLALLNQEHDTIWGTITDYSYKDALVRNSRAKMICAEIANRRLSAIFATIPDKQPAEVLVYNSLPWERECWVDTVEHLSDDFNSILFTDQDAKGDGNVECLKLPASGYILHDFAKPAIKSDSNENTISYAHSPEGELLVETPTHRVAITAKGAIREIRGIKDDLLFTDPAKPFFNTICHQSDNGDLMYCYESPLLDTLGKGLEADITYDPCPDGTGVPSRSGNKRIGKTLFSHKSNTRTTVEVENGDTARRLVVVITGRLGDLGYSPKFINSGGANIEFTQRLIFYADTPRIDCRLTTRHIKGRHYRLRVMFPVGLEANSTTYHEIPFGEVERPAGEFIAQNYMRCEDESKGVAIINKGLPGNNVTENVMMLSLMRSAYQEYLDPCEMALEEGETHLFEYAILPYSRKEKNDFARIALEFNTPPLVFVGENRLKDERKDISLSATFAGISISASEIVCTAIYAEDKATVIRAYNSTSEAVTCEITVPNGITEISETNTLLEESAKIAVSAGIAKIEFKAFEVKTLKCL